MFFTEKKIEKQLMDIKEAIHRESLPIPVFKIFEGDYPGAESPELNDKDWSLFPVGERWGGFDQIAWFRATVTIPEGWQKEKLALRILPGPRDGYGSTAETQLYVDGFPLQALDVWHEEAWLPLEYVEKGFIQIALRAWSGVFRTPPQRRFAEASLVWIDESTEKLFYLVDTLIKLVKQLSDDHYQRPLYLNLLIETTNQVNFLKLKSPEFYHSIRCALSYLQDRLEKIKTSEVKPSVNAIGHSHIDLAWLWQSRHTREKARRTFSTMLHLMRQYPEFYYIHTSPQLYYFVKQDDPILYARVKEHIQAGRWEATGGMWVECDTNIPNGESLVRQIVFGKRFFKKEFGVDNTVLWMPDTFGFSWVLPQLMKLSGLRYFASSVMHWSRFNRFPHDTFYWRGVDGSSVLVNFFTAPGETIKNHYNYNGLIAPYDVRTAWEHYREKQINDELLMPFGWGDGGGGPTKEMLESIRAQTDLPGHPNVKIGPVEAYFKHLDSRLTYKDVPVWDGELYHEDLQGVYTSQARNKRANRLAEILLQNTEWFNVLAVSLTGSTLYPQQNINKIWENLLHLQFHDVLPGTSIQAVVIDSLRDYESVMESGEILLDHAKSHLVKFIRSVQAGLVVFNPLPWNRTALVEIPADAIESGKTIADNNGQAFLCQSINGGQGDRILLEAQDIPAWGYRFYPWVSAATTIESDTLLISEESMENSFFHLEFNQNGQIVSIWDKLSDCEVLAPGEKGNLLTVFDDRPGDGEAWVIDPYYQDKPIVIEQLLEKVVEETGPLRIVLRLVWAFAETTITQRVTMYRTNPRIDFRTELNWQQHQMILKVAFPVNVRATQATYEIQFGNIQRPTHKNTSFDQAHYENPAQKWADLSEGDYGVALLNDSKYGYDIHGHVLRLTLHRSPIEPDPQADQGLHQFTYSLLPHQGTWRNSVIAREAYALNTPEHWAVVPSNPAGSLPGSLSWCQVDSDHVILETLKQAEDEPAWILRLYEYKQYRNDNVQLRFWHPVKKVVVVDLLERDLQPLKTINDSVSISMRPYEIKTLKVWFAD